MRSGLPAFLACCYGLLSLAPSEVLGQNPSPPEIEPRPPLLVAGLWRPGNVELEPEEKTDAQGKSVILSQILTLSPQSSLEESTVILKGYSGLSARNAELRDVTVAAGTGRVTLKNSVLADVRITKLDSPKPAGQPPRPPDPFGDRGANVDIGDCFITGKFEIPEGSMGSMPQTVARCYFVRASFPGNEAKPAAGFPPGMRLPAIRDSHFEKCEVPLSLARRTIGCTFEECRFVDDLPPMSQSPGSQARGFTLSRVGPPGDTDAILAQRKIEIKTVTTRANRFWSPVSSSAKGGAATTEHRIAFGPVVTAFCEPLPATDSAEATASAVDGAVFRARGVPLLFRVSKGTVEMIGKGFTRTGGAARFAAGGRLTWTEASGSKTAWFMDKGMRLILSGYSIASPVLVFDRETPAQGEGKAASTASPGNDRDDPSGWLTGSTWEFAPKGGRQWLRFESPGSCVWVNADGVRGGGPAWPLRNGRGIFVRDWPSEGHGTLVTWDAKQNLSFTRDGAEISGTRLDPDPAGAFIALVPPGTPQPTAEEMTGKPAPAEVERDKAAGAGEEPVAASSIDRLLAAKTSSIGALFSIYPQRPPLTEGAGYRLTATVKPVAGGFESPLVYSQFPAFMAVQKIIKSKLTERFQHWPSGGEIQVSHAADKPAPMSGPAGTLPVMLLMEGLYTGVEWDPEFCVTVA